MLKLLCNFDLFIIIITELVVVFYELCFTLENIAKVFIVI